jgi:hypothetical protein
MNLPQLRRGLVFFRPGEEMVGAVGSATPEPAAGCAFPGTMTEDASKP